MGLWSRIKKGYTSIDRKVGGYLPGGVKPGSSTGGTTQPSTPSAPSSSSSISKITGGSSSGSSAISKITGGSSGGSYNPSTNTYTSPSGQKQSTAYSNVPQNTAIDLSAGGGSGSSRGSTTEGQVLRRATPTGAPTQDAGVLTVTPANAGNVSGSGKAFWTQQSTTPAGAIEESQFTGVPQYHGNLKTRGLYEYNFRNILAGQETYKQYTGTVEKFKKDPASFEGQPGVYATNTADGTQYALTGKYFDQSIDYKGIEAGALAGAKDRFRNLPRSTRYKLNAGGYGIGVSSAVIGFGEFGATMVSSLGQQTIKPGEKFNIIGKPVKFGGTLGEIRNYPTTAIENPVKFTSSPVGWGYQKLLSTPERLGSSTVLIPTIYGGIKGGISNIKTQGWKAGSLETVSSFSPLKIRPGIYAQALTKNTRFHNVKSFKTIKNGVTTRVYSGSSGSIKIGGVERSTAKGGAGFVTTETPTLKIGGGGTSVIRGTRTTYNPYAFQPAGRGSAYSLYGSSPIVSGGTSKILTSGGLTAYTSGGKTTYINNLYSTKLTTGGSSYRDLSPKIRGFGGGQAQRGYFTETGTISQPGRYRFIPKITGREYDITGLGKSTGINIKTGTTTSGSGGSKLKYKFDGGSSVIGTNIPILTTKPTTTTTVLIPQLKTQPPRSKYYGLGQYERTTATVGFKPLDTKMDQPGLTLKTIQTPILELETQPRLRGRSRSRTNPILTQTPKLNLITEPKTKLIQKQILKVRQINVLKNSYSPGLSPLGYNYGGTPSYTPRTYNPPIPPPFIPLPSGAFGGMMKLGNVRARPSPTRYTPSFKALFFKIKGKAPQGVPTGFKFRPITKGFSFQRVRRVRI